MAFACLHNVWHSCSNGDGPVCSRMPPSATSGHFVTASRTWSPNKKKKKRKKKKCATTTRIISKQDEIFFEKKRKIWSQIFTARLFDNPSSPLSSSFRYVILSLKMFPIFNDMTSLESVRSSMKSLRIISKGNEFAFDEFRWYKVRSKRHFNFLEISIETCIRSKCGGTFPRGNGALPRSTAIKLTNSGGPMLVVINRNESLKRIFVFSHARASKYFTIPR